MSAQRAFLLLCAGALLSGCVAVAAPIAVAGAIGGKRILGGGDHIPDPTTAQANQRFEIVDSSVAASAFPAAPPPPVATGKVPGGMQFLYGSGEAAALGVQAYQGLVDMMIARASDRAVGLKVWSAVLAPGSSLEAPQWAPCDQKPLAVVLDIDETSLLNLGFEADDAQRPGPYDPARWDRWEKTGAGAVAAVPGLMEAAKVAKTSGVTLIYNSNRSIANVSQTEAALDGAGLGPVKHLKNLWLQGDEGTTGAKDARRWAIARKYCVIAMVGDQLGDFSDLFNAPGMTPAARRAAANGTAIRTTWGHGWFILPNPVYGTALKGDMDEVFPADKRWIDPGAQTPAPAPSPAPAPATPDAGVKN